MRKQVIKMIKEIQQKEHQTKPSKHISFKEILAGNYVYVPSKEELGRATGINVGTAAGCIIEAGEGKNNLEEIFSVEGIDVAYVGPYDLSMSLGIFRQFDHPKFIKALEMVVDKAKAAGVAPGIHCSVENINHYIERGFQFNSLASDTGLLIHGAVNAIKGIKGWKPLDSAPAAYLFK